MEQQDDEIKILERSTLTQEQYENEKKMTTEKELLNLGGKLQMNKYLKEQKQKELNDIQEKLQEIISEKDDLSRDIIKNQNYIRLTELLDNTQKYLELSNVKLKELSEKEEKNQELITDLKEEIKESNDEICELEEQKEEVEKKITEKNKKLVDKYKTKYYKLSRYAFILEMTYTYFIYNCIFAYLFGIKSMISTNNDIFLLVKGLTCSFVSMQNTDFDISFCMIYEYIFMILNVFIYLYAYYKYHVYSIKFRNYLIG